MINLNTISLFVFIFSLLSILRLIWLFLGLLKQEIPQKMKLNDSVLLYYGFIISYFITYILEKI